MAAIYPQDFGAVGDSTGPNNGTDDTVAINAWFAAMIAQKKAGKLEGLYRYKPTGPINLTGANWGFSITGERRRADGFALDTGHQLRFEGNSGVGIFFQYLSNFCLAGRVDGPLLTIGRDDFQDAFNSCVYDKIVVNNGSQSTGNEGIRVNYLCAGSLDKVTINCGGSGNPAYQSAPGYGTALRLRQSVFSEYKVELGNAKIGLHLADAYSYANDFRAIDIEEVNTGIKVSSPNAIKNMFSSGTVVASKIFDATAGHSNVVEICVNRAQYPGGSLGPTTGLVLR